MARPLRLAFAGALYHITSRGDRREDIYENVDAGFTPAPLRRTLLRSREGGIRAAAGVKDAF